MNWYLAKMVFQVICGEGNHRPQFDEQLRLIAAETETEALIRARKTGNREQETFFNNKSQLVQWKFIDVCELIPVGDQLDGVELYSRIQEAENAELYIEIIQRKAGSLQGDQILRTIRFA